MKLIVKTFLALASVGMTLGIVGFIGGVAVFHYYGKDLPDYTKLSQYKPAGTTRLYSADGNLMAEYAEERRIYMPLESMPKKVIQAFIAAEDQNFYHHTGIDARGILRATIDNINNFLDGRGGLAGGSTITQQVVKNFLLTNEKSLSRKIKEAILAYRISSVYSKDKILELYLNEIYLGMGAYGVVAAAQTYFNKPLQALNTEEVALLAAMPKAPSDYDPRFNPDAALSRRNHYVIRRMLDEGYINEAEAERARTTEIDLYDHSQEERHRPSYFSEEVRRQLVERYGIEAVNRGGLFVKTTMDERLQKLAEKSLRKALLAYDRRHGYRGPLGQVSGLEDWESELNTYIAADAAPNTYDGQKIAVVLEIEGKNVTIGFEDGKKGILPFSNMTWAHRVLRGGRLGSRPKSPKDVVKPLQIIFVRPDPEHKNHWSLIQVPKVNGGLVAMDPASGRVLAMAGGYDSYSDQFNRVTQAKRQPGSAFKPFVYMSALEQGFTPATILVDEPIEIEQGPGLPLWKPKNYGDTFLGAVPLRMGLEKSRNVMTVRLAQMLGLHRIVKIGQRFGIYEEDIPENYSMVLGSMETTLIKLAAAYSAIANGGLQVEPSIIELVNNQRGEVIFRRDARECNGCLVSNSSRVNAYAPPKMKDSRQRIIDPRIAYQTISLLEGVVQRGTAVRAKSLARPVAGKTGTTNDSRDAWFMGFTPELVVGVYIGFDNPRGMGRKETGGRVALPAFVEMVGQSLERIPPQSFHVPKGIQHVRIDRYTGMQTIPGYQPSNPTIVEAFLYGGAVFLPEGEGERLDADATYVAHYGDVKASGSGDVLLPWRTQGAESQDSYEQETPEYTQEVVPKAYPRSREYYYQDRTKRYQEYRPRNRASTFSNGSNATTRSRPRYGPTGSGTGTLY